MPRATDDLISFTLGDVAPARTKTPKRPEEAADSASGGAVADSVETPAPDTAIETVSTPVQNGQDSVAPSEETGYVDVRPIGTTQGLKELAQLYKKSGGELGALERKVHMMLWPLALHFGLYWVKRGRESKRPPLVAAFWARSLAEAPLTLGHLYPPALFKGLLAGDVFEFGGMVIDSGYRREQLMPVMLETIRLFLFSRRPELVIATPVESLHELYKQLGLKTVGTRPIEHPHVAGVRVYLMYGRFKELAGPFFM